LKSDQSNKKALLVECWERFVKAFLAMQPVGHQRPFALHTSSTNIGSNHRIHNPTALAQQCKMNRSRETIPFHSIYLKISPQGTIDTHSKQHKNTKTHT